MSTAILTWLGDRGLNLVGAAAVGAAVTGTIAYFSHRRALERFRARGGVSEVEAADGRNLLNLLYSIACDQAVQEGFVHRGITCNVCGRTPLRGTRYKCASCVDFDVCANCEPTCNHNPIHVFLRINVPIPPLTNPRVPLVPRLYPGTGKGAGTLDRGVMQRLQASSHFDQVEVEALYQQFRCLAAPIVPQDLESSSSSVSAAASAETPAISRATFKLCLGPLGSEINLIVDRMFAFYDHDNDGVIGFSDLVHGLSVLCKGTQIEKAEYAFRGIDAAGRGYLERDDLRRILRAYFRISVEAVRDLVSALEEEMLAGFNDRDDKPVSAVFTAPIPAAADVGASPPPPPPLSNSNNCDRDRGHGHGNEEGGGERGENMCAVVVDAAATSKTAATAASTSLATTTASDPIAVAVPQTTRAAAAAADTAVIAYDNKVSALIEGMSQEAIDELIEAAFARADTNGDGRLSLEEFKIWASTDPTFVAWFDCLGSIF